MARKLTKAVIPAAGRGTRLRPLTNTLPKELLPVGEKPLIQHQLEMYMASEIFEYCIITSSRKPLLNDFINGDWNSKALPYSYDARFHDRLADCRVALRFQEKPKGVAHAILLAADFVKDDPFLCIMPDCLLVSRKPFARQLIEAYAIHRENVIGSVHIPPSQQRRFGNVGILKADRVDSRCYVITSLSDKTREPLSTETGKSIHKGFGGGIYDSEYFALAEALQPVDDEEVDDVPIHQKLIEDRRLLGVLLEGAAFDVGNPLGFRAAVHYVGRK